MRGRQADLAPVVVDVLELVAAALALLIDVKKTMDGEEIKIEI